MIAIESKFIGNFKLGDNVCYNLDIISVLYNRFEGSKPSDRLLLCKPIVLILASIVEAVLYDFHKRVRTFTVEGVKNLALDAVNHIRLASIDDFAKYIDSARKQRLFGDADMTFYERMHDLRKLRNRIHIQNENTYAPRDESDAFDIEAKVLAEQVVEKTIRVLASNFARDHDYVAEFRLPWSSHFTV
jgi:hypothetical protein